MQCYEFELVLGYMTKKVAEYGMENYYDRADLADILIDHDVVSIDQLSDIVSLARNLQIEGRLAA